MLSLLLVASSIAPGAPLLHSPFDLTAVHGSLSVKEQKARFRRRYIGTVPEWDDGTDDDGIQVKLHGTKVRVRMPIPSI